MSVRLIVVSKFIEAIKNSGLKETDPMSYRAALRSTLHDVEEDRVIFRTYMSTEEYWEYTFRRVSVGNIVFEGPTYGHCEGLESLPQIVAE